jgi:hypothetical protein
MCFAALRKFHCACARALQRRAFFLSAWRRALQHRACASSRRKLARVSSERCAVDSCMQGGISVRPKYSSALPPCAKSAQSVQRHACALEHQLSLLGRRSRPKRPKRPVACMCSGAPAFVTVSIQAPAAPPASACPLPAHPPLGPQPPLPARTCDSASCMLCSTAVEFEEGLMLLS